MPTIRTVKVIGRGEAFGEEASRFQWVIAKRLAPTWVFFVLPTIWVFMPMGEAFGEEVSRFQKVTAKRLAPTGGIW